MTVLYIVSGMVGDWAEFDTRPRTKKQLAQLRAQAYERYVIAAVVVAGPTAFPAARANSRPRSLGSTDSSMMCDSRNASNEPHGVESYRQKVVLAL